MVGGALLFGAALHPVTPLAPLAGGILGIAAGDAIAHGRAGWRIAAGALAPVPLFLSPASWPVLAVVSAMIALVLAIGGGAGGGGAAVPEPGELAGARGGLGDDRAGARDRRAARDARLDRRDARRVHRAGRDV